MAKILEDLPAPNQSRQESYLGVIAGQEGATMPEKPLSRVEEYLEFIAENGGGKAQGIFVGFVSKGDSFPTTRPDGSALENEDFVRPDAASEFPFTIGNITFNSSKDKAYYMSGSWYLDAGVLQDTDETPLSKPEEESFETVRANQYQVNKDVVEQLKNAIIEYEDLDTVPSNKLYKRIYRQTEDTTARVAGLYWYNFDSTETDKWEKLIKIDDITIEVNSEGELQIKNGGVSKEKFDEDLLDEFENKQDEHGAYSETLTVAGWSNKQQSISIEGLTEDDTVIVAPNVAYIPLYAMCGIYCSAQADGQLTFTCETVPTNAIVVEVVVLK